MKRINTNIGLSIFVSILVLAGCTDASFLGSVKAAPFTQAFVRYDRLQALTPTGGRVCAKPATTAVEASVQVTFPTTSGGTDYVVNATPANWTVTTTALDSGQTAWPGIGTATAVSGKTVTFPSNDLTVGILYCFNFSGTNTFTTSSVTPLATFGNVTTRTSAPANIDSTNYDDAIITNDQIVTSGIVPPSFLFVLSGNTDAFASNLSTTSVVSTAGRTITITTNAPSGWIVWAKDLNSSSGKGALQSATAANYKITGTTTPGSVSHTLATGAEDYGLGTTITTDAAGGGTVALDPAYDGTSTKAGTLDPTQFRPIASANGTANGDVINLSERATIAGQTPAATDYTDSLTLIGAGAF